MYLKKSLLISAISTIPESCKFSSLKNRNIVIRYDLNLKCLVVWKFTSWEWMVSARNLSNLRQGGWWDWDSVWLTLILNKRLINSSGTKLYVSRPQNWLSIEITSSDSSLNRLISKGKDWLERDTSVLKHMEKNGFFSSMVSCLIDLIRYSSIDFSLL